MTGPGGVAVTEKLPPCPWCSGTVIAEVGVILSAPIYFDIENPRTLKRKKLLGKFSACTGCEFAVEGTWTGVEESALATV